MPRRLTGNEVAEKLRHEAHLRFQRQQLRKDVASLPDDARSACPEQRGCHFRPRKRRPDEVFDPSWFTGLRSNFWKAYFDTLTYMMR